VRLYSSSAMVFSTFTLSISPMPWLKKETSSLPWNATANQVRRELIDMGWDEFDNMDLIRNVQVSRLAVSNGYTWSITFGNNPDDDANDGDQVQLVAQLALNGDLGNPSISVNTLREGQRSSGFSEVQTLQIIGIGVFGFYRLKFDGNPFSNYIAVDATPAEITEALEQLKSVGEVLVTQSQTSLLEQNATLASSLRQYDITFIGAIGNIGALIVDSARVSNAEGDARVVVFDGDNSVDMFGFKKSLAIPGERPVDYSTSGPLDKSLTSFVIDDLIVGLEYYVFIRAGNDDRGFGQRMRPQPPSITLPFHEPRSPVNVELAVNTGYSDSLLISYSPPESDGGSPILRYRVELDPSPDFYRPIVEEIKCPTSNKRTVWKVETNMEGAGTINGGSFALLLSTKSSSYPTSQIPYDAVELSWNETGIVHSLAPSFSTITGSAVVSSTINIESIVFGGDRLRFSGQAQPYMYYEVSTVSGSHLILKSSFDGQDGPQKWTRRYYGGKGYPLTSRIHCQVDENLCPSSIESKSGSIQNKIEDVVQAIDKGVLVDRDGPDERNGFIWRVTFLDDTSTPHSYIHLGVHSNSLTVTNDSTGVPVIKTTMMIEGESYGVCTGSFVVPSQGGLVKGLRYYARASAFNAFGYSTPNKATKAQAPRVRPGAPTGVVLDVSSSSSELRVTFGPPSDNGGDAITQYLIEWSTQSSFRTTTSDTLEYLAGGAPFTKTITNLKKGVFYFVRVRARNDQGYGESQVSTPKSLNPHQRSSSPTNVKLGITSDTLLTIGWSLPLDNGGDQVTKYRVEWDTHQEFTSISLPPDKGYVDVDASLDASFTIELLSVNLKYYARVSAINKAGVGKPQIASMNGVTLSKQVPGTPFGLQATVGSLPGQMVLEWSRPRVPNHGIPCRGKSLSIGDCPRPYGGGLPTSDGGDEIAEYELEWSERPFFNNGSGGHIIVHGTVCIVDNLTAGRDYYFRVLARNDIGSGKWSEVIEITAN